MEATCKFSRWGHSALCVHTASLWLSFHISFFFWQDCNALLHPSQKMLDYLKEKRDAGFFKSLSGLMQSCRSVLWYYSSWKQTHDSYAHIWFWGSSPSVLDLNAFERQNKAEGLGMVTEEGSSKWSGLSLDALCDIYFVFSFKRFLLRFSE